MTPATHPGGVQAERLLVHGAVGSPYLPPALPDIHVLPHLSPSLDLDDVRLCQYLQKALACSLSQSVYQGKQVSRQQAPSGCLRH